LKRAGISGEHQEGGLKRILGILLVPQHTAADSENDQAVAPDESREGGLIALSGEPPHQLGVGQSGNVTCQ
jgi:hypothetical protein